MSYTHESERLNELVGEEVLITFWDGSEESGILRCETLATLTGCKRLDDTRVIGYRLENGLHFKKSHVKKIFRTEE